MTETIHIWIAGAPVGKERGRTGRHHVYTAPKTRAWEHAAAIEAKIAMKGRPPMQGPVAARIEAIFPYPKNWGKNKKLLPYPSKIDLDNVVKAANDSLNRIVYIDDRQIVESTERKAYGDKPGVRIVISQE